MTALTDGSTNWITSQVCNNLRMLSPTILRAKYIKKRIYGDKEAEPDKDPTVHPRTNTVLI